jgi:hypothetical protein
MPTNASTYQQAVEDTDESEIEQRHRQKSQRANRVYWVLCLSPCTSQPKPLGSVNSQAFTKQQALILLALWGNGFSYLG